MMADKPKRIQRRRTKGWRMPPDTVSVTRPGIFGNPFTAQQAMDAGYRNGTAMAVTGFRQWLLGDRDFVKEQPKKRDRILREMPKLRGKNLACFCALDQPCHADVLLEIANKEDPQ